MIRFGFLVFLVLACKVAFASDQVQILLEDVYPKVTELNEKIAGDIWLTVQSNQDKLTLIKLKNGSKIYQLEGDIFEEIGDADLSTTKFKLFNVEGCKAGDDLCRNKPIFGIEMEIGLLPKNQECISKCVVLFSIRPNGQVIRRIKIMNGKDWIYSDSDEFAAAPQGQNLLHDLGDHKIEKISNDSFRLTQIVPINEKVGDMLQRMVNSQNSVCGGRKVDSKSIIPPQKNDEFTDRGLRVDVLQITCHD